MWLQRRSDYRVCVICDIMDDVTDDLDRLSWHAESTMFLRFAGFFMKASSGIFCVSFYLFIDQSVMW